MYQHRNETLVIPQILQQENQIVWCGDEIIADEISLSSERSNPPSDKEVADQTTATVGLACIEQSTATCQVESIIFGCAHVICQASGRFADLRFAPGNLATEVAHLSLLVSYNPAETRCGSCCDVVEQDLRAYQAKG